MKFSLLNTWTDSLRQGFTLTMNAGVMRMAKKAWTDLDAFDRERLTRAGFTDQDWVVLNKVAPTIERGREFITPDAIRAANGGDDMATRVNAFIHNESEYAVVNPDLATKAAQTWGGMQAGTWGGEIARTAMQMKSFPIAIMSRHLRRMSEGDLGTGAGPVMASRLGYGATFIGLSVLLGAIVTQEKQVISGKDPIDMTGEHAGKFWFRALMQGGAAGYIGDLLMQDTTGDRSVGETVFRQLGPTAGTMADLWELTKGNIDEAIAGKPTHAPAEALQFAQRSMPGTSLWWVRPALEHAVTQQLQDALSPGYAARLKARAQKEWGNQYWWAPASDTPDRAPDLSAAMGG